MRYSEQRFGSSARQVAGIFWDICFQCA